MCLRRRIRLAVLRLTSRERCHPHAASWKSLAKGRGRERRQGKEARRSGREKEVEGKGAAGEKWENHALCV